MSIAPVSLGTIADIVPGNVVVPPIDYTSRDYASLVNDMLTLIPSYLPEWTDRSAGDFGIVLLELFAYVGDILNFYTDRVANEAFISTAQQRQSILNLAALLDYTPHGNVAATLPFPPGLQFTIANGTGPSPTPVLIPQGTQVSTLLVGQPIIFETTSDLWVYGDGVLTTIPAQGQPAIYGTGQPNQQFYLGDTTGTIPYPLYHFTGGSGNQVVIVGGTVWALAANNSFQGSGYTAASQVYTVINGTTILFGGGTAQNPGACPTTGQTILIYYSPTAITSSGTPPVYSATPQYTGQAPAIQGSTVANETVGISDGTPNQMYTLFSTPVVDGSVVISVDEGGGPQPWIYKQRIIDAFSSEGAYTLSIDANSVVTVTFGDGLAGRIPPPGALITATYMVGGGAIGNVAPNSLTQLVVGPQSISAVTNSSAAQGGADAETIDHIRIHAPLSLTAINRAVSLDDYAALVLNIPQIAKAAVISTAYNMVNLYVHPAGSFISDAPTLQNRVNAIAPSITNAAMTGYLDDKKMVGTSINVLAPQYNKNNVLQTGYVPINITATIQVLPQYHTSTVQSSAMAALQNLFTFSVVDFGSRISLSSVYHSLMEVEGVDYVNVSVLCRAESSGCADIVCAAYEIPQANPQANTVNVNANGGINY